MQKVGPAFFTVLQIFFEDNLSIIKVAARILTAIPIKTNCTEIWISASG